MTDDGNDCINFIAIVWAPPHHISLPTRHRCHCAVTALTFSFIVFGRCRYDNNIFWQHSTLQRWLGLRLWEELRRECIIFKVSYRNDFHFMRHAQQDGDVQEYRKRDTKFFEGQNTNFLCILCRRYISIPFCRKSKTLFEYYCWWKRHWNSDGFSKTITTMCTTTSTTFRHRSCRQKQTFSFGEKMFVKSERRLRLPLLPAECRDETIFLGNWEVIKRFLKQWSSFSFATPHRSAYANVGLNFEWIANRTKNRREAEDRRCYDCSWRRWRKEKWNKVWSA